MKNIFIFWIMWQLIVIGWTVADMHNKIVSGTYNCTRHWNLGHHVIIPRWKLAVMPLALFIPGENISESDKYCQDQLQEHHKVK
jgi:hypothetical protein